MARLSWKKFTKQQRRDTEPWIRNKADELAVDNGCWFDPVAAARMIWWAERFCRLYEGEFEGEPVIMRSVANQPDDWQKIPELYPRFFDDDGVTPLSHVIGFYVDRMNWHNDLLHSGAFMDWQFECHARIYGWQRVAPERWVKYRRSVRRFSRSRTWIAKKNKKSPSLGVNSLYLTFGDGEPGAKTFIVAKDGGQATKSCDHAINMRDMSPSLRSITKVNLNQHRISHVSQVGNYLEPLSSSNVRTQDAKHGVNGNIVYDEGHVVDQQMADIVKDAGISRSQALEMMFSTFGNNPDGWGKDQWDFGEQVNAGTVKIDNFFHASYHCPQDLTPRQAKKDPEKYIRMANPALGHTVGLDEAIPTFWSVVDNPSKWSTFAYQRLMIWQHASVTWLPPDVWPKCGGHKFDDQELRERPCVLGLDLAQKRDLAACVPSWRNELDGVDIAKAMFWCNQERIDQIGIKFPRILEFVQAGLIRVNEGDVTDMRIIKNDIREFCMEHNVRGVVYDAKYAEWMIQQLVDGELDPEGNVMVEGLPIGEQSISQGVMTQTGPVVDFENGLRAKLIRHDDNPILGWQFGHASVYTDKQGNRKIQKDTKHSHKTVDGCQAAVMARWGAVDFQEWAVQVLDYYEKNAVEFV